MDSWLDIESRLRSLAQHGDFPLIVSIGPGGTHYGSSFWYSVFEGSDSSPRNIRNFPTEAGWVLSIATSKLRISLKRSEMALANAGPDAVFPKTVRLRSLTIELRSHLQKLDVDPDPGAPVELWFLYLFKAARSQFARGQDTDTCHEWKVRFDEDAPKRTYTVWQLQNLLTRSADACVALYLAEMEAEEALAQQQTASRSTTETRTNILLGIAFVLFSALVWAVFAHWK